MVKIQIITLYVQAVLISLLKGVYKSGNHCSVGHLACVQDDLSLRVHDV